MRNLGFVGGLYGVYLLLGLLVKRKVFSAIPSVIVFVVGILTFVGVVALQIWLYSTGIGYSVWYSNGLLCISALCFFELFSRAVNPPSGVFVRSLAKYSFAIYLVHFPIKMLISPWIGAYFGESSFVCVPVLTAVALLVSWVAVMVLAKIPFVGPRLLYIR